MKVEKESWDVIFERLHGNMTLQRKVEELEDELAGLEVICKGIVRLLLPYVIEHERMATSKNYKWEKLVIPYSEIAYICRALQKEETNGK